MSVGDQFANDSNVNQRGERIPPRISIAMATYNGARYIRAQLDSLAAQTLLPYELVVTDDGSSDTTLDIVTEFAHEAPFPVHIHSNKIRLGYAANFLRAAALCEGDFIAFCDQDDVWMAKKIFACVSAFAEPDVLLVMHATLVVDADLRTRNKVLPVFNDDVTVGPLDVPLWEWRPGFSMIVRKSCLSYIDSVIRMMSKTNVLKYWVGHDRVVYLITHSLGKVVLLKTPLALYRQHSNNVFGIPIHKPLVRVPNKKEASSAIRFYLRSNKLCKHLATMMDVIAQEQSSVNIRENALKARQYWSHQGDNWRKRASLYCTSNVLYKVTNLGILMVDGAYRPSQRGGFGLRGLAKDLLCGLFARHVIAARGTEEQSAVDYS